MRKLFCLMVLSLASQPAFGQTATQPLIYEITANGFHYGAFSVTYVEQETTYDMTATADAQGLFGFMLRAHYTGTASGVLQNSATRQSEVFEATSKRIFKSRTSRVTFSQGVPKSVKISPKKHRTEMSDPAKITHPVMDPLSYLAGMVINRGDACPAVGDLYDGRRVTRISFVPRPDTKADLICDGTYDIVAGPDHSLRKGYRRFGVVLVYARAVGGELTLRKADFISGRNLIELALQEDAK